MTSLGKRGSGEVGGSSLSDARCPSAIGLSVRVGRQAACSTTSHAAVCFRHSRVQVEDTAAQEGALPAGAILVAAVRTIIGTSGPRDRKLRNVNGVTPWPVSRLPHTSASSPTRPT